MSNVDTEQPDDAGGGTDHDPDEDLARLRNATAALMEHFDTVHIFATRHINDDDGTVAVQHGGGNWYARKGQIDEWIVKQDADAARDD